MPPHAASTLVASAARQWAQLRLQGPVETAALAVTVPPLEASLRKTGKGPDDTAGSQGLWSGGKGQAGDPEPSIWNMGCDRARGHTT